MGKEAKEKEGSIFDEFTRKYQLSKTLRFSLVPVLTDKQESEIRDEKGYESVDQIRRHDRIEKFFADNKQNIFEVDIERKKRYKALKYYLTELHKLFIKDALERIKSNNKIDFLTLYQGYKDFETCKDDKQKERITKTINKEKVRLAKFFGDKERKGGVFQEIAKTYHDYLSRLKDKDGKKEKIKGTDDEKKGFESGAKNILLSQNVLRILEEKIKDGSIQEKVENDKSGSNKYALSFEDFETKEQTTLVEYFDGWSTYFKNFNEVRGNLYKDEGRKEGSEESEGGSRIKKANAGQLTTRILDENFEIFVHNAVWAEKNKGNLKTFDFQGKDIIDGTSIFDPNFYGRCLLQTDINVYNAKIAEINRFFNENKEKNKEIKYLKPLFKQLILTDKPEGEEDAYIQEFVDDSDLINGLEEFYKHSKEKIEMVRNFLRDGKIGDDLADIQLDENQLHFFCNKYFGSWSYLRDLYYRQNKVAEENKSKKEDEFRDTEGIAKTDLSLAEIKLLLDDETREDFVETVKSGWFCFDPNAQKADISSLMDAGIYRDSVSNFENFISFLKFEIDSLLNGRTLLSKKEVRDKNKIAENKKSLEEVKTRGERVDDLLLSTFSKENFTKNLAENIEAKRRSFEQAFQQLQQSVENKKKLARGEDFEYKKAMNEYCSRISDVNRFFALFSVPEGATKGTINNTVNAFKQDNKIVPLFNAIRNFITKKPDDIEKIKLNFDESTLLKGWGYKTEEHPKSTDYKCRIFRKNNQVYLGIVGKSSITLVDNTYQIMDYYQLDGKGIFNVYRGKFGTKYGEEDRLKLENETLLQRVEKIIDENLWKMFPKAKLQLEKIKDDLTSGLFNFEIRAEQFDKLFSQKTNGTSFVDYKNKKGTPTKEDISTGILKEKFGVDKFDYQEDKDYLYNRIKEIMKNNAVKTSFLGVDKMVYELTKLEPFFYKTSFSLVRPNSNETNIIALFQIYCKDFSPTRGINVKNPKKDLQTLYFEELFSEANEKKPIFKLSGMAEVFFREKMDDYKSEQWEKKDLRSPKTDKLPNKKRRFTENQILFHVPIVLNNINDGGSINRMVHKNIQKNEDMKILGIDRGEKELAYYCLLDKDGKICGDPQSLNVVGSNILKDGDGQEVKQSINYRQKLDIKEKERMMARRSWTKIEGIKDLKSGYISNVVNEIARLMVNNNAMMCLEELNRGFKRDRSIRIEKGVYQRLENALVDKLNYLVLEKTPEGVRNALQLTPENKAIKYWGNQMGTIFYTDAKFTSKTCPHCGFRKRGVESMKTAKEIKEKIEKGQLKVFFERDKNRFRVEYSWRVEAFDFSCEDLYGKEAMEVIYSDVERDSWNNDDLKHIFKDYLQEDDVELFALVKNKSSFSYVDFGKVFNSLIWLRHTVKKDEKKLDRISCPKCHFSTMSLKAQKIKDGDANGAYNIAKRGLIIFEKIRSDKLKKKMNTKGGIKSSDLKITLKEWDEATFKQWDKKDWEESENRRGL